ncbi:unnamed protein product, partial [Urochloa humidicola]
WFQALVVEDDAAVIGSNQRRSTTTATRFLGFSRAVAGGFGRRTKAPDGDAGEGARPRAASTDLAGAASALCDVRVKASSADRAARHHLGREPRTSAGSGCGREVWFREDMVPDLDLS